MQCGAVLDLLSVYLSVTALVVGCSSVPFTT